MKKNLLFIIIVSLITACEDVIDVNLNNTEPRLIIDASINWYKNSSGNEQQIKLSLLAPFFEETVPPANDAIVTITDSNDNVFDFLEDGNTGIYKTNTFVPVLDETYTLTVLFENETYIAQETLKSVVEIDFVEQNDNGGFSGNDIELKAFYTDPAEEENHYLFEFISDLVLVPTLEVYEDRFTNGNQIFGFYTEEDLESGDQVIIRNFGVSKEFYEFMFILLQQGSVENGGPFETQPATVRGNCINQSNPDNFPFGYFRLSEVDEIIYTIN